MRPARPLEGCVGAHGVQGSHMRERERERERYGERQRETERDGERQRETERGSEGEGERERERYRWIERERERERERGRPGRRQGDGPEVQCAGGANRLNLWVLYYHFNSLCFNNS